METLRSLASGIGGRSLGTERPPASTALAGGAAFAREVERAARTRGRELALERADEQDALRRADRRAGFGQRPADEDVARGVERDERPGAGVELGREPEVLTSSSKASADSLAPAAVVPASAPRPLAEPAPTNAPEPVALPVSTSSTLAAAATPAGPVQHELAARAASPTAARPEPSAIELAATTKLVRERGLRAAAPERASAAPDPALLERAEAILRQIELRLVPGLQRLTLDLEPAELGRLSIQLAFKHGKLAALVRAEREQTLQLLELRAPELVDLLAQHGIDAEAVQLELGRFGQKAGGNSRGASEAHGAHAAKHSAAAPIPLTPEPRDPRSLVDTYA